MSFAKFTQVAILLFVGLATIPSGRAQTFKVLYSFTGGADGAYPNWGVIRDSSGNLYGTTQGVTAGTVFKLSPTGSFKRLHSFPGNLYAFSRLVRDSAGNLYGTIYTGGAFNLGEVYRVNNNGNFSVLYNFPSAWWTAGLGPLGPLILDAAGNLYGAGGGGGSCPAGNSSNCGVVFKLDPSGKETVIRAFLYGAKGFYPNAGLIRDAAGNLYGTTEGGGRSGAGVVFKLDSAGNETVLYTFKGIPDGAHPWAGLIRDAAGNFYGTTPSGGNHGCGLDSSSSCGVVFKLDTNGHETLLHTFTGGADGGIPSGALVMDSAGNLYGTANYGVLSNGDTGRGVIFKLSPSGEETVLYTFTGGTDGNGPYGGLTMDSAGNLYGTAFSGGKLNDCTSGGGAGCGVVFKITP